MCELLGMNCNVPTDIRFSFSGLIERGGRTGPHRDCWGVAFYEGNACRTFHDPQASCDSEIAELVRSCGVKSLNTICHIRKATHGRVCLANTHPFTRELWGRHWLLDGLVFFRKDLELLMVAYMATPVSQNGEIAFVGHPFCVQVFKVKLHQLE